MRCASVLPALLLLLVLLALLVKPVVDQPIGLTRDRFGCRTQFFVPLEHAEAAMAATAEVSKDWHLPPKCDPEGRPFANYTDIRVVRGDEHWMSPTTSHHGGDTIAMVMGRGSG